LLGGAQGVIGWWMVKSGLVNDPAVSQYRLATHLMMAMLILGLLLWTGLDARGGVRVAAGAAAPIDRAARRGALVCMALLVTTIAAGAFVAGLDAGLAYNTFPLMDGQWVPPGYLDQEPWWRNHLENTASVQFNHRLLATVTATVIVANWLYLRGRPVAARTRRWAALAAALAGGQFALGVAVILLAVPVALGALHQLVAVALFAAMVTLVHGLVRPARG
ncbi:MAG: COX15/CtaA family protein, partial [Thalassobaculaceae bacterium]